MTVALSKIMMSNVYNLSKCFVMLIYHKSRVTENQNVLVNSSPVT